MERVRRKQSKNKQKIKEIIKTNKLYRKDSLSDGEDEMGIFKETIFQLPERSVRGTKDDMSYHLACAFDERDDAFRNKSNIARLPLPEQMHYDDGIHGMRRFGGLKALDNGKETLLPPMTLEEILERRQKKDSENVVRKGPRVDANHRHFSLEIPAHDPDPLEEEDNDSRLSLIEKPELMTYIYNISHFKAWEACFRPFLSKYAKWEFTLPELRIIVDQLENGMEIYMVDRREKRFHFVVDLDRANHMVYLVIVGEAPARVPLKKEEEITRQLLIAREDDAKELKGLDGLKLSYSHFFYFFCDCVK